MSIKSTSTCIICNLPVTDSIEEQIERHGKIKLGHHSNKGWICDDCSGGHANQKESKSAVEDNELQQHETIEPAKASDVSPNTPKADEAKV
jgi:hypothetical protein